jgi:hypothetical protein
MPKKNSMKKMKSKCLVIDTCVVRASGQKKSKNKNSRYCRKLLDEILRICHRVVITDDIVSEWDKHESSYAVRWRSRMKDRRKIVDVQYAQGKKVRSRITHRTRKHSDRTREAIIKDIPFVEAALASDLVIISLDDEAKRLFRELAEKMDVLGSIIWMNPLTEKDTLFPWLEKGAKPQKNLQLRSMK